MTDQNTLALWKKRIGTAKVESYKERAVILNIQVEIVFVIRGDVIDLFQALQLLQLLSVRAAPLHLASSIGFGRYFRHDAFVSHRASTRPARVATENARSFFGFETCLVQYSCRASATSTEYYYMYIQ